MFRSLSATQEMLLDSQRTSCSGDSALFSLSQMQQSQPESSQVRTQELFSQKLSGSQNEGLLTSNKKMTMYEKWMNKGTYFKRDSTAEKKDSNKPMHGFLTDQQQCHIYQNKAKERDERDLLQQVVSIVQECSKEVKSTLDVVKFKLDSYKEFSGENFNEIFKSFLEDISSHEERMLHAVEKQKNTLTRLHELERELAVKNAELQHLQNQQQKQDTGEEARRVAKAVRQELLSPNLAVKNKLEEILEVTRETSKHQCQQLDQCKKHIINNNKQHADCKSANQRLIKDTEKRLLKEITNLCNNVQQKGEEWHSKLQEQLAQASATQMQDIEKLIEKLCLYHSKQDAKHRGASEMTVWIQTVRRDIQALLQKQAKSMESCMQEFLRQISEQGTQLKNVHAALAAELASSQKAAARHTSSDLAKLLSLPKFEEKMEVQHAELKQQLEELHQRHLQEVLRIQNELKRQLPPPASSTYFPLANSCFKTENQQPARAVLPKRTENSGFCLQQAKGTLRISPLSKSERANLFRKTNPSPVVAVLPQRQVNTVSELTSTVTASHSCGTRELPSTSASNVATKTKKQKRKSSSSKKKSSSKRKRPETPRNSKKLGQKLQVSSPKRKRNIAAGKKMPNYGLPLNIDSLIPERGGPQNHQNSPSQVSDASTFSSPSVSLTEVVVVRRSRWHAKSEPQPGIMEDDNITDILSTPCMQNKAEWKKK